MCKTWERVIRKEDDQLLFFCCNCLEDKFSEIVADAKSGKIEISRDLQECIDDICGPDESDDD